MESTAERKARELGTQHGNDSASWMFDGNTSHETYEAWRKGLDDGDPEYMDRLPSPLSGEWADEYSLSDLSRDTGVDQSTDEFDNLVTTYVDAFTTALMAEIERTISYHLQP